MTESRGDPVIDTLTRSTVDGAYHCPACDSPFTRRSNLRRHYAIHTRGTGYQCTLCNRFFARSDQLRTHIVRCESQNAAESDPRVRRASSLELNPFDAALGAAYPSPPSGALSGSCFQPHLSVSTLGTNMERTNGSDFGYLPPILSLPSSVPGSDYGLSSSYGDAHSYGTNSDMYNRGSYPSRPSHLYAQSSPSSYLPSSSYHHSSSFYPSPPSTASSYNTASSFGLSHSVDGGVDRSARITRPTSTSYPVPPRRRSGGSSGESSPHARVFNPTDLGPCGRRSADGYVDGLSHSLADTYSVYQAPPLGSSFSFDSFGGVRASAGM